MRTLKELVNFLNDKYCNYEDSSLSDKKRFTLNQISIDTIILKLGEGWVINFSRHGWRADYKLSDLRMQIQHDIVEFAMNTSPEDWFRDKKYYIAIGQFDEDSKALYYKKTDGTGFSLLSKCDFNEKDLHDNIIFTEKEIEELKATLSENMARIVDLGKVEVKDE